MDANDGLAAGPVALIVDANLNVVNRNNTTHTAGTTFVGQFLDHDVTFDATSQLGVPTDPEQTRNTRVPALDLDAVYGGGPSVSPQLYQSDDRAKLRSSVWIVVARIADLCPFLWPADRACV
jgi:hypothetical protein